MDRTEERRGRAQAPRLSPLCRDRRRPGHHTLVRRIAPVRELLPAFVQAGDQAPRGRSGLQALLPTTNALRAPAAGGDPGGSQDPPTRTRVLVGWSSST